MTNLATQEDNAYISPHLPGDGNKGQLKSHSFESFFRDHAQDKQSMQSLLEACQGNSRVLRHFAESARRDDLEEDDKAPLGDNTFGFFAGRVPSLFENPEKAFACLDAYYWDKLISRSELVDAMSSQRRAEWNASISKKDTPPFERETVISTLNALFDQQGVHFAERVESVFKSLSPEHITNSPAAFGKRMIINEVVKQQLTVSTSKTRILDDLRIVVAIILRRSPIKASQALSYEIVDHLRFKKQFGQWESLDGGALRIKVFQVGTVHIEIHPDVAFKLNDVLSMLYPHAIPARFRRQPTKPSKSFPRPVFQALPLETLTDLDEMRRLYTRSDRDLYQAYPDHDIIYDFNISAFKTPDQTEAVLLALGGTELAYLHWSFDYDVTKVIPFIIRTGVLPDKKSHQFYPSKGSVGEQAVNTLRAHLDSDKPRLLEPSVGHGHLVQAWTEASWTMLDIAPLHAQIVSAKGLGEVIVGDFLAWAQTCQDRFDGIPMNPPYSDQQAVEHVDAAFSLLTVQGVLTAIVPDGTQFQLLREKYTLHHYTEAITEAFDDAGVCVRIITLRKEDNR